MEQTVRPWDREKKSVSTQDPRSKNSDEAICPSAKKQESGNKATGAALAKKTRKEGEKGSQSAQAAAQGEDIPRTGQRKATARDR